MTGLLAGLALGGTWALLRESRAAWRQWREDRAAEMIERRLLHAALKDKGYDVCAHVKRHGPLVVGTPWNQSLAQLHAQEFAEADQP